MKVAVIQTKCCDEKQDTLNHVEELIKEAQNNLADVVVLPEMFICPYEYDKFPLYAEEENGYTMQTMSYFAKKYNVYIFAGTIPEKDGENLYNTAFVFDNKGNVIGKYRKKHLFDIDIKGKMTFKESSVFCAGEDDLVVEIMGCKIGVAICFDVRFPYEFTKLRDMGAKVIVLPASFNMTTGPAHWELLLRARAMDNQCYFIGCASALSESSTYSSWGHSMIINPWGEIVDSCEQDESIIYSDIDVDYVKQVRNQIPVINK